MLGTVKLVWEHLVHCNNVSLLPMITFNSFMEPLSIHSERGRGADSPVYDYNWDLVIHIIFLAYKHDLIHIYVLSIAKGLTSTPLMGRGRAYNSLVWKSVWFKRPVCHARFRGYAWPLTRKSRTSPGRPVHHTWLCIYTVLCSDPVTPVWPLSWNVHQLHKLFKQTGRENSLKGYVHSVFHLQWHHCSQLL